MTASVGAEPFVALARRHRLVPSSPVRPASLVRPDAFERWLDPLVAACRAHPRSLETVADWVLDNDYRLRRAARLVRRDLGDRAFERLPAVAAERPVARALILARALLDAHAPRPDGVRLAASLAPYQRIAPLREAELWALPALMRLVCLERLVAALAPLADVPRAPFPPAPGHAPDAERGPAPDVSSADPDADADLDPGAEVGDLVTALVALEEIDWRDFVGRASVVETLLAEEPAGIYAAMAPRTRLDYRRRIERLARRAGADEPDVARHVIERARAHREDPRRGHVGHWLTGHALADTERSLGARPTRAERLGRVALRHAGVLYAAALVTVGALALAVPLGYLAAIGASAWARVGIAALALLPASVIAIGFVHWLVPRWRRPERLPALDPRGGIPPGAETVVAVPVIVRRLAEVEPLLEQLEIRRLANPDPRLTFVLLSDLADAPTERTSGDEAIERALADGIERLDARHRDDGGARFAWLHRPRRFEPAEGAWMGRERKRGKLEDLDALLVDGWCDAFAGRAGEIGRLPGTRYVLTLDADTALPPDSAAALVCTLAHPLNRARVDPSSGRVREGYTVLQPRVETLASASSNTLFAYLHAGDGAIDIYSRAVSDVYQDLFGEGSYTGKGLYDVRAFRGALDGRVPENRILSHDLFEGLHGRVALATDTVLYEGYPAGWAEHAERRHRWIRGDWQLLPWIGRTVPGVGERRLPSVFSGLDRWKLVDNLRRSLVPPALLAWFLGGWFLFPGSATLWTVLGIGAFAPYLLDETLAGLARAGRGRSSRGAGHRLGTRLARSSLALVFLVGDARVALDAIGRALWRTFASARHRLEWTPAAENLARHRDRGSARATWRLLWPSPALALGVGAALPALAPASLAAAAPLLIAWLLAPAVARLLARPRTLRRDVLDGADRDFLRRVARRTWHYFDTFAGPDEHWLVPDNYQRRPVARLARRTSPTNIGLQLASTLAARELGFIGTRELVARVAYAFDAIERLPRFRGHLLNWYDTATLEPLEPRYVSTVDSGNLAVALVALAEGCRESGSATAFGRHSFAGLLDTLHLLGEACPAVVHASAHLGLESALGKLAGADAAPAGGGWRTDLVVRWAALERAIGAAEEEGEDVDEERALERHVWLERFDHQLGALIRDADALCPWLACLEDVPSACREEAHLVARHWPADAPLAEADVRAVACREALGGATSAGSTAPGAEETPALRWRARVFEALTLGAERQRDLHRELESIAGRAARLNASMDFGWLYDDARRLLRIGHDVSAGRDDPNHYDLLASEARTASLVAIARRDVPLEHWFALGRPVVRSGGRPTAQSWSGSMFEYLMPPLFLVSRRDTLLGDSEACAVLAQRAEATRLGLPWGVSESAFAATDDEGNYQYRAFGTRALGIRRGLARDRVVAPYASLLALGVWPHASVANLRRLVTLGALGRYGFVDALDFTPDRRPPDAPFATVETWMAHHHGMSLVAIVNALHEDVMAKRTLRDPALRSVELLLHERVPWEAPEEAARVPEPPIEEGGDGARPGPPAAWLPARRSPVPPLQLLGNGRLSARHGSDGASTLYHDGVALTRGSGDAVRELRGGYRLHVGDARTGRGWWIGERPDGEAAPNVVFAAHEVDVVQHVEGMTVRLESAVAAHEDTDIRLVTLVNEGDAVRTVRLTSHAEVALARPEDDVRHPAFARMFVESRIEREHDGLSFARRPREPGARGPALLHRVVGEADLALAGTESDRRRWLGRHGDPRRPAALAGSLSGTAGFTLDPVMVLEVRVTLAPGARRRVAFLTLVDASREALLARSARLTLARVDRLLVDARAALSRELERRGIDGADLAPLQSLASIVSAPQGPLRASHASVDEPGCRQEELWAHGVSGDRPICLLRMDERSPVALLETLVRGQGFWRQRGFTLDLVVLRTGPTGYDEPLRTRVIDVLRDTGSLGRLGRDGGVHLVSVASADARPRLALEDAACVVLDAARPLAESLLAVLDVPPSPPPLVPTRAPEAAVEVGGEPGELRDGPRPLERPTDLLFDNGLGGFDPDGESYVLHLAPGERTPAPWCNVLANERFGAIVSESGLGFSWAANSGERRLTRWSGDPVLDTPGEMLWLRDEASAELWCVPPMAPFDDAPVEVRHALGHTLWRRHGRGLEQTQLVLVPPDDPVRLVRLTLVNRTARPRRLTATYFADWVLGSTPEAGRRHARAGYDARTGAILARNDWNADFAGRLAFLTASRAAHSVSGDRRAFVGEAGDLRRPAALARSDLGGHFPPGGDPCGAWQVHLDLAPGERAEVVFVLGEGATRAETEVLVERWRDPARVDEALGALAERWERLCGAVHVRTPDPAFDLMINRWLIYQNVSSRLHARAGFYQASGAFGYRDQLQDVLALLASDPALARRQILAAARHQFDAGDALHWWHPPSGRGVRTRCSDDRLWLAYTSARYVECTGDHAVLDVEVPFLVADELDEAEGDRYAAFESGPRASLFEHCARALERGIGTGAHGLPPIGTGDWNDGMDRVGDAGRGESVWLAWFRIAVVGHLAPLAEARGARARAALWREHAASLAAAIEREAWDGEWYVRAFDDEGVPWGSAANEECRIDAIAQAWSAIAGAPDAPRTRRALASAEAHLVDREHGLARLLTPPFHDTPREPGYIKSYPPGIRENGGQYTHAAAWLGLAFARAGDGTRAHELFSLLHGIARASTREGAERYRVEPYVLAADVGGAGEHEGVGGWSWYTGAAGWAWQLGVRGILGIEHVPGGVRLSPRLPRSWPSVEVRLRSADGGTLALRIESAASETAANAAAPDVPAGGRAAITVLVDGELSSGELVEFPPARQVRRVTARLGDATAAGDFPDPATLGERRRSGR